MLTPVIRPRSQSGVSSWRTMFLMTVLTVSDAPVSARQVNVSQNDRESPNTTVASPYPVTAQSSSRPRNSTRSVSGTIAPLANNAPDAGAAYSQPYPSAPTCSTTCAKMGKSAVADEKNVAKKSSSIVDRMSDD